MRKIAIFLGLLLIATSVQAAVTTNTAPTSLVTSDTTLAASSGKAVFEFALTADAAETLSSVAVTVNSSTASASDFASVAVYRDNGDGIFNAGDSLAGSNTTVNVGSTTTVATASNNTLTGAKFYVVLNTSASWSGTDSATVTFNANGIVASSNSPTNSAVTTAQIVTGAIPIPDTIRPALQTVVAVNKTGGTAAKEAGDKVVLTFDEATTKPAITAANIASVLTLNNSHSWLDGVSSIGGSSWNTEGTILTITLSAGSSLPTVAVGDTVTVAGSVIQDAAGNPATGAQTITGSFGPIDSTGPVLSTAVAKNTGGTSAKEAGDSVALTFNEATNKPTISASNIASVLTLNNSHSWLDGALALGGTAWNAEGTMLTITLSAGTSLPTVAVGDTVTISGSVIKDAAGNNATGTQTITGSFTSSVSNGGDDDDEDEDHDFGRTCADGIVNGKLYKIGTGTTVYLAANCSLKPFRGAAVFHARGHKFKDIITLPAVTPVTVSNEPALPAGGTLVKGSDATVWFVTSHGKRKGFVSALAFTRLGFSFGSVKPISDSDLNTMSTDVAVTETSEHPEGSIIMCGGSPTIFEVKNNAKFGFTNPDAFLNRGHGWDVVAVVDCTRFSYLQGTNVQ